MLDTILILIILYTVYRIVIPILVEIIVRVITLIMNIFSIATYITFKILIFFGIVKNRTVTLVRE